MLMCGTCRADTECLQYNSCNLSVINISKRRDNDITHYRSSLLQTCSTPRFGATWKNALLTVVYRVTICLSTRSSTDVDLFKL